MTEMPLLIFTLIEQMTVGAFATLVVMHFMGKAKADKATFVIAIVLLVLAVLGMAASMTHLGQPLRAMNVLRGVGSSPLSHEIIFFGGFVALVAVYAVLAKLGKEGPAKVVGLVGAACGVLAIVFTSICYMTPGVPAWNSIMTPAQFVLTVVACGIPLYLALAATFGGADAETDAGAGAKAGSKKKLMWWGVFAGLLLTQIAMRYFFFSDIALLVG